WRDLRPGKLGVGRGWKQQVGLVMGVIAGALVIPPVLDLMNHTYGFVGAPGADPKHALPAPQAGLISSLGKGVIAADIDWSLIGIGGAIGGCIILLDEILARTTKHMRVPPLAVGLGIYLPTSSTLMIVVGAVAGWFYDRRADRTSRPEAAKQLGVLLASGLIVGEGIIAVVITLIRALSTKPAPLALVGPDGVLTKGIPILANFETAGIILGGVTFAAMAFVLYRWILRMSPAPAQPSAGDQRPSKTPTETTRSGITPMSDEMPKSLKRWEAVRKKGKWKFLLQYGLFAFGLPMFIVAILMLGRRKYMMTPTLIL